MKGLSAYILALDKIKYTSAIKLRTDNINHLGLLNGSMFTGIINKVTSVQVKSTIFDWVLNLMLILSILSESHTYLLKTTTIIQMILLIIYPPDRSTSELPYFLGIGL